MSRRPTKLMGNRAVIALLFLVGAFIVNIGCLVRLQIFDPLGYKEKAAAQQISDVTVSALRGTIYDSKMNVIAQSATAWKVYLDPSKIPDEEIKNVVKNLAEILDVDEEKLLKNVTEYAEKEMGYYVVKEKVENDAKEKVNDFRLQNSGYTEFIGIESDSKRYYPNNNFASSVIGFTAAQDAGRAGIELQYDSELTGTPGRTITAVNALSFEMTNGFETTYDAQAGTDLVLTIDSVIQHYLEKSITQALVDNKAKYAYGIVMDVKTGAILAMTTQPDYNLNDPYTLTDNQLLTDINKIEDISERSQQLLNAQFSQWRNRCISDTYEPGSVFKTITASAGLEEGVVSMDETLNCPGYIIVGDRRINCHNHAGHGTENFTQGLMNSCNPWFVTVGQRLGVDTYMKYFEAFGFTEQTGIDLPAEFQPVKGVHYYDKETMTNLDLASVSFGQSFQVSPLQMITAVAAIGNGGKLMEPYVVQAMTDSEGNTIWEKTPTVRRQVISEKVASQVAEMMEAVVTSGGGQNAYVAGYHVAGKTGTSEKLTSDEKKYIASFCCFAPSYDPEIAVIIVIDEPSAGKINGSTISAPVAGEVVEQTLKYLNVEPRYSANELAVLSDTSPDLVGKSITEAKRLAESKGFEVKVIGSGTKVLRQSPEAGSVIPKEGIVILYTEEGDAQTVKVPDLTGLTLSEANKKASNAGLNIKISGNFLNSGDIKSYKQSIEKDSSVAMGTTITVYFRSDTAGNDLAD